MANTTEIEYKEKGFWIGEVEMEMIFYFILKTFKNLNPSVDFKEKMLNDLEAKASGAEHGYLVIIWEKYFKTEENEQEMISILEETISDLNKFGEYIPIKALKEAAAYNPEEEYRTPYKKPLKTTYVIEVINTLILMLKGEWEEEHSYLAFDHYWD